MGGTYFALCRYRSRLGMYGGAAVACSSIIQGSTKHNINVCTSIRPRARLLLMLILSAATQQDHTWRLSCWR